MSATAVCRSLVRQTSSVGLKSLARAPQSSRPHVAKITSTRFVVALPCNSRCFSRSTRFQAGIMPDSEDPTPPSIKSADHHAQQPTDISDAEYHQHADFFMDTIHEEAEKIQESREDVEVEYSAGVLSITFPPNGTYVINKQPANKQIWLASPLSGPKRYDWVLSGEAMHQKEGGGSGDWVYLRDHSTLNDLLSKEVGISINLHGDTEALETPSKDFKD
nr:frataxin like, mitochondrial [Quercus suber]